MSNEIRATLQGLNDLASDLYGSEWRISDVLESSSFSKEEIMLLKTKGLKDLLCGIDFALQYKLLSCSNGVRFYQIIYSRYGLFGHPKDTLQVVGDRLGISRERVRQLQEKALRRLKPTKTVDAFSIMVIVSACKVLGVDPSVKMSVENDCDESD